MLRLDHESFTHRGSPDTQDLSHLDTVYAHHLPEHTPHLMNLRHRHSQAIGSRIKVMKVTARRGATPLSTVGRSNKPTDPIHP